MRTAGAGHAAGARRPIGRCWRVARGLLERFSWSSWRALTERPASTAWLACAHLMPTAWMACTDGTTSADRMDGWRPPHGWRAPIARPAQIAWMACTGQVACHNMVCQRRTAWASPTRRLSTAYAPPDHRPDSAYALQSQCLSRAWATPAHCRGAAGACRRPHPRNTITCLSSTAMALPPAPELARTTQQLL